MTRTSQDADALKAALRSCRAALRVCVVFSLMINMLMIAQPLYMLQVYDRVLTTGHVETLVMITLITVAALAVMCVLDALRSAVMIRIGCWLNERLGPAYLACGVRGRLRGDTSGAQPLRDISQIQSFIANQGLTAFFDAPWVPIFLAIIWVLHPLFGLVAISAAVVLLVLGLANEFGTRSVAAEASRHQIEAMTIAEAAIRNAEVVYAMNMLPALVARWTQSNGATMRALRRSGDAVAIIMGMSKFVRFFVQVGVLGVGAWLVLDAKLAPGSMIAASILLGRALAPVEQAIGAGRQFMGARLAYDRLKELIEEYPPDLGKTRLPDPSGSLVVDEVSVRAATTEHVILRRVSFSVTPGELLAIVGPSGGGKSTLCRLLIGVSEPTLGEVRLDGSALPNWNPEQLAAHIGYLPQDIELFRGTIAENISRMRRAPDEEVLRASLTANAHRMIQTLPEGYDTRIGDGGVRLSGGQRQRIGLARAVFGSPRIVILDEPNANLDQAGEIALMETLDTLKKARCAIVIVGHRASTLAQADRILVLKEGNVALVGPREEVLHILTQNQREGLKHKAPPERTAETLAVSQPGSFQVVAQATAPIEAVGS